MTRTEYLAMRARFRGQPTEPATCAACQKPDCSHPDLVYAGILPATEFANLHDANDTTAHFFGGNPLANLVRHDVCQNGAAA